MGSYLRGDVIWGPAEGPGRDAVHHVFLAHPEVSNLDVPLGVQHDIIQLQVPAGKRDSISAPPTGRAVPPGAAETEDI